MKWRVRMRRVVLVTATVGVLVAAATIPILASAPASSASDDVGPIPWQLSGAIWGECQQDFPTVPSEYGVTWDSNEVGTWRVWLFDQNGAMMTEEEAVEVLPELAEPLEVFRTCLNRFPSVPYRMPPELNGPQRALYWSYVVRDLVPCLRGHGRTVELPSRREFANTDYMSWYMQQGGYWDGSGSLEEQLTMWNECPMLPSYLEQAD